MNDKIAVLSSDRRFLLDRIKDLSDEQFNRIPEGFNNNIIWNLGHMISVQQGACYKRAGLQMLISDGFWSRYGPGSRPDGVVGAEEIWQIMQLMNSTMVQFGADYNKSIFGNYKAWKTRYGAELINIDDGIDFLAFHERLHTTAIMAIHGLVKDQRGLAI